MAISRISLAASHVMQTAVLVRSETKASHAASRAISMAVMAMTAGYALGERVKAEPTTDLFAPIGDAAKRIFGSDVKVVGNKLKELEKALADLIAEGDRVEGEVRMLHSAPMIGASGSNPDRGFYEAMGVLKDRQQRIQAETQKVQRQLDLIRCQLEAALTLKPCGKGI